jgi:integrase
MSEPSRSTRRSRPTPARGLTASRGQIRGSSLPEFAVTVLRGRRGTRQDADVDAVFPTRNGTWQQVNNVEGRWRQIRKDTGLEWVTPHAFRGVLA